VVLVIFLILVAAGGDDDPCEVVHELCEKEISEGIKSPRDVVCKTVFWNLKSVWNQQDEASKERCVSWIDLVEQTDDAEVKGIEKWKEPLSELQQTMDATKRLTKGMPALRLGAMKGEWFDDGKGGRRLELSGTLLSDVDGGEMQSVRCESTAIIRFKGAAKARTSRSTLAMRDVFPAGSQVRISTQAAVVVGSDERDLVESVRIDVSASAIDKRGAKITTGLAAPSLPRPMYRQSFSVGNGGR
jgi:hypothetical protein